MKRMSDLISRQKTIKTIYYYFEDLIKALPKIVDSDGEKIVNISKTDEYLEMYKAIRELIIILPSEKPKTGEWIFAVEIPSTGNGCYVCSKCGSKLDSMHSSFCSNCGADMREGYSE